MADFAATVWHCALALKLLILRLLMYRDKKIVVVMPAYNAARTVRQTHADVREQQLVDAIILVDDGSRDDTVAIARGLEGVQVHVHEINHRGYVTQLWQP